VLANRRALFGAGCIPACVLPCHSAARSVGPLRLPCWRPHFRRSAPQRRLKLPQQFPRPRPQSHTARRGGIRRLGSLLALQGQLRRRGLHGTVRRELDGRRLPLRARAALHLGLPGRRRAPRHRRLAPRVATLFGRIDIEPEIGFAHRFGRQNESEVWIAVYGAGAAFPGTHVVTTTAALSTGLNLASGISRSKGARRAGGRASSSCTSSRPRSPSPCRRGPMSSSLPLPPPLRRVRARERHPRRRALRHRRPAVSLLTLPCRAVEAYLPPMQERAPRRPPRHDRSASPRWPPSSSRRTSSCSSCSASG
jgi:hypothetical protein